MTPAFHRIFAILATLSVVASVAWGFTIVGSPDTRRQERMDDRRLEALRDIQREIQELLIDSEEPGVLRRALPAISRRAGHRRARPEDRAGRPRDGPPLRVPGPLRVHVRALCRLPVRA